MVDIGIRKMYVKAFNDHFEKTLFKDLKFSEGDMN